MLWRFALLLAAVPCAWGQMILTSSAFNSSEAIPARFGCDVQIRNPFRPSVPLQWARVPAKTQSLVLVMDDMDAENNVHWLVTDISPEVDSLPSDASETGMPAGAKEIMNAFGEEGYSGPCPFNSTHTYRFRLFAMPVTTYSIDTSNNRTHHSDNFVLDLEKQALYVSVLTATFSLGAPEDEFFDQVMTINITRHSSLRLHGQRIPACHWELTDIDAVVIDFVSAGLASYKNETYEEFLLLMLIQERTHIIATSICDEAVPYKILIKINILAPKTTEIVDVMLERFKPKNPTGPQSIVRFVKPSQVRQNIRSHNQLHSLEPICQRREGQDDCVVDPQMLVEQQHGDNVWSCPAQLSHSRASRLSNGDMCTMRVRVVGSSCSNFSFPASSVCSPTSPGIEWMNVPESARSLVVMVEEGGALDHASSNGSVLWLINDISSLITNISAGASGTEAMPALSVEYPNTQGTQGFTHLCPDKKRDSTPVIRVRVFAMPHPHSLLHVPRNYHANAITSQLQRLALCSASVELPVLSP